jgi:hypothetical protein
MIFDYAVRINSLGQLNVVVEPLTCNTTDSINITFPRFYIRNTNVQLSITTLQRAVVLAVMLLWIIINAQNDPEQTAGCRITHVD